MPLYSFYTEPGVYVRTIRELAGTPIPGNLRLPMLIGEGSETVPISNLAVARGSSNALDIQVKKEDVTARFLDDNNSFITPNSQTRTFRVKNTPIVKGDGTGAVSNTAGDITVTINDQPAGVLGVNGETGEVILAQIPVFGDVVKISYFYDKRDTLISDEDVSYQVDGVKTVFKIQNPRVVDGTNSGTTTNIPENIVVKVNGSRVSVVELDGLLGLFTLATAPALNTTVTVTYYSNNFEDTSDPLPDTGVLRINSIGDNPGRTDYINTVDYVLSDDQINWGSAYIRRFGTATPGGAVFEPTNVSVTLVDNYRYMNQATGASNGVNKSFIVSSIITDGSGRSKPTDRIDLINVYVGSDPVTAFAAGPVQVAELYGAARRVVLQTAPALGENVYVSYYYSLLTDATYEVVNKVSGGTGVGKYTITSPEFTTLATLSEGTHSVADANFSITGIVWPDFFSDLQSLPGVSISETVTVTFTSITEFEVSSSVPGGTTGTGVIGQTYVDSTTGMRFTILDPQNTPDVANPYSFAVGDTLEFVSTLGGQFDTALTPNIQVPGLWVILEETTDLTVDDSVQIQTFNRNGSEPAVGSLYYVDYEFEKVEFGPFIVNTIPQLETVIGPINLENRLSLAGRLAFRNGAIQIGVTQVRRAPGQPTANDAAYIAAIEAQTTRLPGDRNQDVIVPLSSSPSVFGFVKKHVETQSSEFNNNRRIAIFGLELGTAPLTAINLAKSLRSERCWLIYPDGVVTTYIDAAGRELEAAVSGVFLAAAISGLISSPTFDPATPLINKEIVDVRRLVRNLDSITAREVIKAGTVYLVDQGTSVIIKDAYTTRYEDLLYQEPNVTLIDDDIADAGKRALNQFIGRKSLSGIEQEITTAMTAILEVRQGVTIAEYGTPVAIIDANDPRVGYVNVAYRPIFSLKWLLLTLSVRSTSL